MAEPKPLAIEIGRAILADNPEIRRGHLGTALSAYTRSTSYLERLIADAPRIDLSGAVAGRVTAEEARHALDLLKVWPEHGCRSGGSPPR